MRTEVNKRGPISSFEGALSSFADVDFASRFKLAAAHAKVQWGPTAISESLGRAKQTVARWMDTGTPSAEDIFLIAERWKVDARWLATGKGQTLPHVPAGQLEAAEQNLLDRYRGAAERWKLALDTIANIATVPASYSIRVNIHTRPDAASHQHLKTVAPVTKGTDKDRMGQAAKSAKRPRS